jgi:ribosomal protein S18 acetylase RimI-like enzyme
MEIRRIRLDEAELVARIYTTEYAPGAKLDPIVTWLQNCALHPTAFCLVAEEDGEITGFVIASQTTSEVMPGQGGEVEELHVRDRSRRDELGRRLVEDAIALLVRRGSWVVVVDVDRDAPDEERALWRSLGFEHHIDRFALYHDD